MISAPPGSITATSFIRRALIDRITGPVHTYWQIVQRELKHASSCEVTLAEGAYFGHYVLFAGAIDSRVDEVPGAITTVIVQKGSSPDMLTRSLVESLMVSAGVKED